MVEPIFEIGKVPFLPHCAIQQRKYEEGKWKYAIQNSYNAWASGWGDEDWLIEQVEKAKKILQKRKAKLEKGYL